MELLKKHPNAEWHDSVKNSDTPKRILTVLWLNAAFALIEFIGGILTGSVAIIADAIHDLGDSISLGVAWYLEKVARKGSDKHFSYGYGRFSLLSAVVAGVVLFGGMIFILIESLSRFWEGYYNPSSTGMIFLAILGIVMNGAAAFHLAGDDNTQNEKILTWHLMEDVLAWVAVLVGAILILAFDWKWIDPLLAILIALYIGYHAGENLMGTLKMMLQSVPENFKADEFIAEVEKIEGVAKAHDLHVWTVDGKKHVLSLHVVLDEAGQRKDFTAITAAVREVAGKYGEFHCTVELEKAT